MASASTDPTADRTPSQRQIAAKAGVSVSTVSRALSRAPGISDRLRQRIVGIAQELGYERAGPGANGAMVRSDAAITILAPLDLFSGDASGFYHDILRGIEDELKAQGRPVDIRFLEAPIRPRDAVEAHARERPHDGLLLMALDQPEVVEAVMAAGCAAVIVNGSDPGMRLPGVVPANIRGARLAAQHLLALGHRRILAVTARNRSTLAERHRGFVTALGEAGAAYGPELLVELPRLHPDLAFEAMRARLAAGPTDFTAVFCGNDLVALGVLRALDERGIAVPEACSVLGFDDVALAALSRPRLSTVAVERAAIGQLSVRLLIERLVAPEAPILDLHLGCRLILRETTATVPKQEPAAA